MNASAEPVEEQNKTLTGIIYALYATAPFIGGVTGIVAIVLNYLKRDDVKGTWLESHFHWQMRTFWIGLVLGIAAFATFVIGVGVVLGIGGFVWYVYRIAKGWLRLSEGKPV